MPTQALKRLNYFGRRMALASAAIVFVTCVSGADQQPAKDAGPPAAQSPVASAAPEKKAPPSTNPNEAAIRATAEAFTKAFNAGDAKAVAALWTANGTVADEQGNLLKGRQAIEDQYAALFKSHPTARMHVAIKSIDFPTATTAVEDGSAQLLTKDNEPPTASRYTVLHVQEDGKWLMASVRESAIPVASNFAQVRELGWLTGHWEAKADGVTAKSEIRWIANKSFLQRDFSVSRDGLAVSSGTQIIGWDGRSEQVVSWTFDSSGGHGTGAWTLAPDGWRIESSGVTAEGIPTRSKDQLIRVPGENNVFGWRSADRKLGDGRIPDVPEVVFDRVVPKR
ncbi:MAG TPA: SgcJ/EcaC family oxidoreductase [Planctomycetaceae bacterium]|nr:SgcJ/EcaC family oxidoreductase [Planctomycetaceae bacterium]